MKTLLLNDTSWYHYGCKEVINNLKNYYSPTTLCGNRDEIDISIIEQHDLIVLNGEGTLHHNAPWAKKFLGYISQAQQMGKQTHLVNSVWQQMSDEYKKIAAKCDVVEVREVLSQREIDCNASIVLDASIHSNVPNNHADKSEVCLGGDFYKKLKIDWHDYNKINIFNTSWQDLVNTLRNTNLLITGRHHEMYAALKAKTRVITVPGNTWKNEGFFHTMGTPELIMEPTRENIKKTLDGYYDEYWEILWKNLNNFEMKYGKK
jgi:polysaccharide pyruvyl transferase WcaK-like protein